MTEQDNNEETFDDEVEEQEEPHKGFEDDAITKSLRETQEKQLARREEAKAEEEKTDLEASQEKDGEKDTLEDDSGESLLNKGEDEIKVDAEKSETTERSSDDYPATWKGELKDKWAEIDPDVRAEIHRREGDMLKGMDQYRSHYSYAQDVIDTFKPYDAAITASGSNQKQVLQAALNTMFILKTGSPDDKANELLNLAANYGIELNNLNSVNERIEANMPLIDPAVEELKRENAQILTFLQQTKAEKEQQEVSLLEADLDKFEADPANKYYAELREEMARIFGSSQEDVSIQEVYDKAVWANPVTREKLIVERQDTDRRNAAEKAAGAKRTAKTNVASKGQPLTSANQNGTLDNTIEDVWADIKSRR